jgi:hypothetical protein
MKPEPPESAMAAMVLLAALAVGLVMFVELVVKQMR